MNTSLNLLIRNTILDNYIPIKDDYITYILGTELRLPEISSNLPFLFSCFALSIDGKLCYPDNQSGFSIINSNHHATIIERKADWWFLMLSRSICDALIVGSTSLNRELKNDYIPIVDIEELIKARKKYKSNTRLWTIVIVRDLSNINFNQRLFNDPEFPVLICYFNSKVTESRLGYTHHKISQLTSQKQLGIKNLIAIDTDYSSMLKKFKQLGFNIILNESPNLHHIFLEHKLLDEIWLNYSMSYIGGITTSLGDKQKAFSSSNHPDTQILTLHHLGYNFLYSRQKVL